MKKLFGNLLLVAICVLISENVFGQGLQTTTAATTQSTVWPHKFSPSWIDKPLSVQGADLPDKLLRSIIASSWICRADSDRLGFSPNVRSRITLPGAGGFLDSVHITLDSITGDSILVYLISDTLFQTTQGPFHLMNIFDQNAETYEVGYIQAAQVHGRTMISLPVPHAAINAHEFWIAVEPNFDPTSNNFTNAYRLIGDSESIEPRTADNSHTGFLASIGGNIFSAVFDSTFLSNGGDPLYANFYITAFVDVSSSSVTSSAINNERIVAFPNPASDEITLNIPKRERLNSIELRDMLGRVLLTSAGDSRTLDISRLNPGRYEAIINSTSGITVCSVVIQR